MKKRILAVSLVVVAGGIAAFFLVRANQTIQQQRQALRLLSAKVDRLERAATAAPGSVPGDELFAASPRNFVENSAVIPESSRDLKAEVDRLSETVAKLQAQLNGARSVPFAQVDRNSRNDPGVNRSFKVLTNGIVIPSRPGPGEVPKNWTPFEFNGATYYTVPLALAR